MTPREFSHDLGIDSDGVTMAAHQPPDAATFYSGTDYHGSAVSLPEGDYILSQLEAKGIQGKSISSLKVTSGCQVIVYKDDNFQGDSRVYTDGYNGNVSSLTIDNFDDVTLSLRIFKPTIADPATRDGDAANKAKSWWTQSMQNKETRIRWWRAARFGCFIHWGAYSILGGIWNGKSSGTYSEHIMRQGKIPLAQYKTDVVAKFNPTRFDAEDWVRTIRNAGMKYLIITAKHHDGFAVYRSDVYYYDLDLTPFTRDPMAELRNACAKHGIKFGFYYSHAWDWEHPDAPGNDWDYNNPAGDRGLFGGKDWFNQHPQLLPRVSKYYLDQKSIPQVLELIQKYNPDILWFDTPSKMSFSESLRVLEAIRQVSDTVVVNGRLARGTAEGQYGDYANTADRPAEIYPFDGDWEAIPTTNESYAYKIDDNSHKPVSYFVRLMAKAAARGGNILMNIGPQGDGTLDERDLPILRWIGEWIRVNGDSIYGTAKTPLDVQAWGESTKKGNTLYLHVFDWPRDGQLVLGGLKNDISKAYLLSDPHKAPLTTSRINSNDVLINVPTIAPDVADTVIVVEIGGNITTYPGRLLSAKFDNVLRAFDAQISAGMGYGDGKVNNDYVESWRTTSQVVRWRIRLNEPMTCKLSLKYATASESNTGKYRITIGDQHIVNTVSPTAASKPVTVYFDAMTIPAGEYDLMITPLQINGGELMRLYNVALAP